MSAVTRRRAYHHGDLPTTLVDAALELISESGLAGFSVAEAARRSGVSISAPYRHFSDREELLAAIAARGYGELLERFERVTAEEDSPAEQLAAASAAYVRFAAERRPMFEVLFGAGLDKSRHASLGAAAGAVIDAISAVARKLAPRGDGGHADALVKAITGLAQGHATLLLDGGFGAPPDQAVDLAAERAAAATRALVRGRRLLFEAL